MNTTSPKSSLAKLGLHSKQKPLRVMVLGQSGVGKTGVFIIPFMFYIIILFYMFFILSSLKHNILFI